MKERITRHWDGRAKAYDENVRQVIYSSRESAYGRRSSA